MDKDRQELSEKEKKHLERLQMLNRAARLSQAGLYAAGYEDLADVAGDVGELSGSALKHEEGEPGALRKGASNVVGSQAGKLANKKYGIGGGKAAALGGAVSGALKGEGVGGIAKTSVSWYLLYIAFGALFTIVGSVPALLYLDFHYVMSKLGSKLFGEMFLWQKIVLLGANLLAGIVLIVAVTIPLVAMCNVPVLSQIYEVSSYLKSGTMSSICSSFKIGGSVSVPGGLPAGDPVTGRNIDDLVALALPAEGVSDPRLRACMQAKVARLYELSQNQNPPIDWVVTSALRLNDIGSYHSTGEAADIALRNPTVGLGSNDPRISRLMELARSLGFVEPNGNVVDEYHQPTAKTEGAHIHLEFNFSSAAGQSYCDLTP